MQLYNNDCLQEMDKLIANNTKVDCIITSPPYNMNLRVHSGRYMSRWGWKGNTGAFAEKYENYRDDLSMDEYFEFQREFLEKALTISNLVFYNNQFITGNKVALCKLLGHFAINFKEIIIWDKVNAQPAMSKNTLNSQFEIIIVFEKNKPYNRMFDKANFERGTLSNVWQIKSERNLLFKAGFPTELVRRIIENFTDEGEVIMDPFMGSGTTGVVCKNLKRHFIGIELDENYFKIAKSRIEGNQPIEKETVQENNVWGF